MSFEMETVLRLMLGALLGGIIGFERQRHGRPAGLRTHLLVTTASVLVMAISAGIQNQAGGGAQLDAARLAAGALTGIGFLGAGVIVKSGVNVQGLTTAASIWITAVIGLAVGAGLYLPAVAGFIIAVFSLWILRYVELRTARESYKIITVKEDGWGDEPALAEALCRHGMTVENAEYERDREAGVTVSHFTVGFRRAESMRRVLEDVARLPGVRRVEIKSGS